MATITANTGSGSWGTGATWVGGNSPTAADDAVIPSGATVTQNGGTVSCRSLTVQSGGAYSNSNVNSIIQIGDGTAGAGNVALSINSGATFGGSIYQLQFISTSATQQTIDSGGKTLSIMVINGAGSSYLLSSALTLASTFTLTAGTFDTGNYNTQSTTFSMTGSTARTLTAGSSTITVTAATGNPIFNVQTTTNLTMTANTATFVFSGQSTGSLFLGGFNYNGASFSLTSAAQSTCQITGGGTIKDFTWTGPATKTSAPTITASLTVTGAWSWTGNSAINRSLLSSGTMGTTITISAATNTNTSNVDFKDITFAGAATWTGTSIGDSGGNSGITVTTPVTRYAVAAGNVSSTATWSSSTGGGGGSSVPLPQDAVFFDSSSGAGTYTNDMPRWGTNVDFTGFTRTFSLGLNMETYGSWAFSSGMTLSGNSGIQFGGRTTGLTITSAGQTIGTSGVVFQGPGGEWTLQDALNTTGATVHTDGTLITNGFSYTTTTFTSSGTRTRVLTFGASTVNISATSGTVWAMTATGLTINAGTSNIVISTASASTRTFTPAAFNYNTITYNIAGSSGQLSLTAAAYIAKLDMDISSTGTARTLQLATGSVYTIADWHLKGSSGNVVTVQTSSAGTAVSLALLGPVSSNDWLAVKDITSIMPHKFYAGANSTNTSGNTNVVFSAAPSAPSVWQAQNTAASGTTVSTTFPASQTATAGNVLLAFWGNSATAVTGMTGPSGYTLIDNTSTGNSTYMWYKIAAGGETGITVTTTSSHATVAASLMEIGSFTGTPTLDVFAHTDSVAALTSQASASVTNTGTPAIAVAGFSGGGNTGAFVSITNSWQEQRYTQQTVYHYFALPLTSTGANTTTYTWTTSRSSSNAAVIFKDVASAATAIAQRMMMGMGL